MTLSAVLLLTNVTECCSGESYNNSMGAWGRGQAARAQGAGRLANPNSEEKTKSANYGIDAVKNKLMTWCISIAENLLQ